ncbi:MAG: glycosyltransferase family 61 protein [Polaromonas sp.]|nr:glycosyltransferase family 61 protein [Polaromonas sp.]
MKIHYSLIERPEANNILGTRLLELNNNITTIRSSALFSDDPDNTGRTIPNIHSSLEITRFVMEIQFPWIMNGHRWLINSEQNLFMGDTHLTNRKIHPTLFSTDRDTGLSSSESGQFNYLDRSRKTIKLSGKTGLAVSAEPSNWGSFLFQVVPKLAYLKQLGVEQILMYQNLSQQRELADIVGFSQESIEPHFPNCNYSFELGILCSQFHTNGFLDSFSISVFSDLSIRFRGRSKFGKRIYISRRSGIASTRTRRCINEDELSEALENIGFSVVIPDQLSVAEQISAFSNADFVIGPAGAGLFNAVFCKPGTLLFDIESERHWIYAHCSLFSSLNLRFGIFWGKPVLEDNFEKKSHLSFSVNIPSLISRIDILEHTQLKSSE